MLAEILQEIWEWDVGPNSRYTEYHPFNFTVNKHILLDLNLISERIHNQIAGLVCDPDLSFFVSRVGVEDAKRFY